MNDEFGGVALEEPTTDQFGGVAVEEPTQKETEPKIQLTPYEKLRLKGIGPGLTATAGPIGTPEEAADIYASLAQPAVPIPRIHAKSTLGQIAAAPVNVAAGLAENIESPAGALSLPLFGGPVGRAAFAALGTVQGLKQLATARTTGEATEGAIMAAVSPLIAKRTSLEQLVKEKGQYAPQERIVEESVPRERAGDGQVGPPSEAGGGGSLQPETTVAEKAQVLLKPTATETTPPAAELPATPTATGLRPAIRLVGGEVVVGDAGKTHPDIISDKKLSAADIDQRGFVDQQGNFLDREQAAVKTGLPTEKEPERLHSTDLPEAKSLMAKVMGAGPVQGFGEHTVTVAVNAPDLTGVSEEMIRNSLPEELQSKVKQVERFRGSIAPTKEGIGQGPAKFRLSFKDKADAQKAFDYFQRSATAQTGLPTHKEPERLHSTDLPESRSSRTREVASYNADLLDKAIENVRSRLGKNRPSRSELFKLYDEEYRRLKEQLTPAITEKGQPQEAIGMGAATPQEFPGSKDSLAQLTETIKYQGRISPQEPFSGRLQQALGTIAQKWKDKPQSVGQALERARAGSAVLIDKYLNLPQYTDFIRAIREWTGADNETALEVRRFVKQLRASVPNKLRQEAITNWIQADGDANLLRERASASAENVRPGYEAALQLTEAEKSLARNIQSYLDSRLQEGINTGILKQGVDNYVTQVWKREAPPSKALWADLFGNGTLNPNFKYARKRIFDSYFTGEQAGFTPKDKSIGTLIGMYDLAFNRALSARALIKQLHEGKAADGQPIVMISGKSMPVGPEGAPPEAVLIKPNVAPNGAVTSDGRPYRNIDHWALRDWKWATKGPDGQPVFLQGDMLVHPDHYRHLNNVLKSSRLAQPEGVTHLTRAALKAGALAKQTKLSLSLFHLDQEGLHAMAHRVNPANLEELDLSQPNQRSLVYHGLQVADPKAQELFSEGLAGGGLVGKIPGIGRVQTWFNDFLFRDYIPRLKMNMALDALNRNMKAYANDLKSGKITEDQVMALTADESNAAFGELNYRALGRSPTVQDFFRLTLLAPDFLEARSRFVGQALKPYGREQRIALALMGATLYTGARILNQWTDDDPHWNKPFSVIYNGREYRLRTILGDVQHLITDPRSFWYNRMSPFTRTAIEYVTGRDDRGIKRNSMEQLKDLAEWFRPIVVQRRSDQTAVQSALQSVGVSSKKYGAQTQLFELVDKWKKNNPDPKVQQQYETHRQETLPDSIYRPLRDALQKGDTKQAKEEYKKLLKTKSVAQINQAMLPRKPFTGSWRNEHRFLRSLSPDQHKLYNAAMRERQDLFTAYRKLRMAP